MNAWRTATLWALSVKVPGAAASRLQAEVKCSVCVAAAGPVQIWTSFAGSFTRPGELAETGSLASVCGFEAGTAVRCCVNAGGGEEDFPSDNKLLIQMFARVLIQNRKAISVECRFPASVAPRFTPGANTPRKKTLIPPVCG